MLRRLGPALFVIALTLPANAIGATTVGSPLISAPDGATGACPIAAPCTVMLKQVGAVDQAAPSSGVVVGWAVRASLPDSGVQLRIVHPTDSTHYTPWATGPAVDLAGTGAIEHFAARLPITKGDYLAVRGTDHQVVPIFPSTSGTGANVQFSDPFADRGPGLTGSTGTVEALLQATIEPDADGDGYGDETQDLCPHDAHDQAPPCGATTVGPSTLLSFDAGAGCGPAPASCLWVNPGFPVPATGVVVRYRVQTTSTAGSFGVRPVTITGVTATAGRSSPDSTPAALGADEIQAHVPVTAGDFVGLRQLSPAGIAQYDSTGSYDLFNPDPDNDVSTPFISAGATIAFNADIEPDADHDGFGDSTQDTCISDPTSHDRPCTADMALSTGVFASIPTLVGSPQTTGVTVTNAGPADAPNATVTFTAPAGTRMVDPTTTAGSCSAAATVTCSLGTMHPGARANVLLSVITASSGLMSIGAHAASDVLDPNPANDDKTLFMTFSTPVPAPAPKPCSVSKQGTAKENTIAGTAFGDKISGLAGRDIIHGNDGDDCLYGGLGDDVLFGDAGNDRLYGQTGADRLIGGTGDDTLSGSTGKDSLSGEAGNDTLTGGTGDDRLSGGAGNDTLSPGIGHDQVTGGAGNDTVDARDRARDTIDCGPGNDTATVDRVDRATHCEHVKRR